MAFKLNYVGHSGFYIDTETTGILIDPFITGNPKAKITFNTDKIDCIFLTHAHGDHLGDSITFSKDKSAQIFAVHELANYCSAKGADAKGISFGGWVNYEWGRVIAVPAFHSSSTPEGYYAGSPCGYILEIEGTRIYHAGDTSLNSEMKMIGEVYKPDIVILPIGGHYTMDIENATIAAQWLGAKSVIPMHYNTFDAIKVDIADFELKIKGINLEPVVLKIGESF